MMRGGRATAVALIIGVLALVDGLVPRAVAQEATPLPGTPTVTTPMVTVTLHDVAGHEVGSATLTEAADRQVLLSISVAGLTPGEHGIHIHETGVCDSSGEEPFASAGEHFNPTHGVHDGPPMLGTPTAMATPSPGANVHAGDLGNLTADANGNATLNIVTDRFTLSAGPTSLQDADGSALVIHADPDDLTTQPSGNSGPRVACGVIYPPQHPQLLPSPCVATPPSTM